MVGSRPLALELEGVCRSFPVAFGLARRALLHDVDLVLEEGATLALVGPNGSGKSTLLRLLAGVDRASGGRISVLGGDPKDPRVRARLAFLPEESPFPPELSARATLDLIGALQGLPRATVRERGARLLERVGLAERGRTALRRYSRGMLRRFGLAQAFLAEPELVLLDEPTAGLDAPGFDVLAELLEEARVRGATVVMSSHLSSDVHASCDHLAVVVEGRVAGFGSPAELLGAEGRAQLEVEGLDDAALGRLEVWLEEQGARIVERRPSGRTLLELYRAHGARDGK